MTDNTKSTRYMVYISFDRSDNLVRYSFVSHLSASLRRKGMIISSSFKESTENIKIEAFVVVVSEKYLLDAECLNELADIVDCRQQNSNTVVVVPVFYGISQLEVVQRSDILRDLLPQGNYSADTISRWTSALKKMTDDYKPRNQDVDCGLVEDISRDVYQKVFPTERIGIYSRLLEIKNLLCKQSWGIRSIGIWGMPGIGKTTLAKAAFDQMSGDYEASCFIEDFDLAFRENGLYGLLKEYFGKTLMEEFDITGAIAKPTQKRVLIVLDNVCKPLDADSFLNGFKYFGPGSLIILTSRNKQVFVQCCIKQIYEVKGLNESEAKQLFSQCASRKGWGTESDQETLTPLGLNHLMSIIEFASGNPLALSLYAKLLSHKTPKEMKTECLNLKKTPPSQIMKAFKSSYDTLSDNEKTMFLDIACFFSGEDVDYVMQLFGGCGFFPLVGIYVLVEKCLVTISENKVQMHNLIEIIGRQVANEEIVQHKRHCRLWDASIIQPLLEDEETKSSMESEGVEDIEAIFLEISNLNFFVKSIAFKSMHNLRFLKIYSSNPEKHQGLRFHKTLESLPNELRLLHWEDYPLQSLPQDFDPKHLVELNMPYSQLHKLWGGTKTLEMLKTVRLCHSQQLVEIDDLLKAQNIEVIDLRGCIRFQRFIATGHLQHLRVINLTGCIQIINIPEVPPNIEELYLSGTGIKEISTSNVTLSTQDKLHCRNCRELVNLRAEISRVAKALNLKHGDNDGCLSLVNSTEQDSLKVLDLSGCSDLKNIQAFPRNLKELYLSETAIREVSSSISFLTGLNILDMTNCKGLQHLPMGMSNLTSLVKLMLSGCSELESIQDFPRNLKELYLAGTAIKEVPSSLCDLSELVKLDAGNCKRLENLPIGMCNLISLVTLTLSGCSELEDIHDLPRNLQILNLAETPIRKMPSSFEDLTELIALDLNHCKKLQNLRMGFFRSAVRVELSGCSELEYILGFSLQSMVLLHIDGTNKVMLHGTPPCKVSLIWENWRRFQLLPREMTGSRFILTLMPSVTTPYGSKLPFSISSSLVSSMYAVVSLLLSNTFLLDIHIPQEICHFPSLKTLDLEGSGFRKLPESLKQIRNMKRLILCHCPNLESLPEIPQSLELLNAHSCVSLKNIHWNFQQFPRYYIFSNCFNLSPDFIYDFLEKVLASVAHMAREDREKLIKAPIFSFSIPASVSRKSIFHLQVGSSVKIQLAPRIETLLGFRVSVVVSFLDNSYKDAGFGIRCVCRWENKKGLSRRIERIFDCLNPGEVAPKVQRDHMFVFCDVSMHPGGAEGKDPDILDDTVVFEFLPVNGHNRLLDDCCLVTKCGVNVISAAKKVPILYSRQPTTCARSHISTISQMGMMGGKSSKYPKCNEFGSPATPAQIKINSDYSEHFISYERACLEDPKLESFDPAVHERINRVINKLASGTEIKSLSFDSLREVTQCLLDMNQDVVKFMLQDKEDIWKNQDLFCLVEMYFESTANTMDFCSELENCINRARRSQVIIQFAVKQFEEEMEIPVNGDHENIKYEKTLEELKRFKELGDLFTKEFYALFDLVYKKQVLMLEELHKVRKLDKRLENIETWRRVSNMVFVSAFVSVLILSVVAAAAAAPPVVVSIASALAVPVESVGTWCNTLWMKYEKVVRRQNEIITSARILTDLSVKEMDDISILVRRVEVEIESLLKKDNFSVTEEEVVRLAIDEIKKKFDMFTETIEELGKHADKYCSDVTKARTVILQRQRYVY